MKGLFEELKEQGFAFVPYEQIKGKITADTTAEEVQQLLGMKDRGAPNFGEFAGSTQAVIEYPNANVSLVYKPNRQEFEIMIADKQGQGSRSPSVPGIGNDGIARVRPDELGDMLDAISRTAKLSKSHIEPRENHMDEAEFRKYYDTDSCAVGEGTATFDYQGLVKLGDGNIIYKDVLATNGLLKSGSHPGIHVGTDGIVHYSSHQNHDMKGPEDVGEYNIYITVPGEIQKKTDSYCQYDSCYQATRFDGTADELREIQSSEGWIVMRLSIDPKEDPHARDKVAIIHQAIVHHIEQGRPLYQIDELVRGLEDRLMEMTEADMARESKALGLSKPKALPEGMQAGTGEYKSLPEQGKRIS